jgi:filamentous hemagglutinin
VNGEKVLVPVLYLAQADNRLAPNGALIAGKDVTLIAGQNLDNVGTLKATNNRSATAGNDLVNSGLVAAGNRLDLLAGNDITNKAGGIIAGRDVTVTAIGGDVTNERTITSLDSDTRGQLHKDYADNAARIEAANDLSVSAGRDINNIGSALQSGRDLSLNAGRDVNIASTQVTNSLVLDSKHTSSDSTQIGATVSAGRDLSVQAGRDVNAIASQIDAKRDIAIAATENVTISSAADEDHFLSKSKKLTVQEDHVSQVATDIKAGGSVAVSAGQNLAVISSRITAGEEAYLVAGDKLDILAAQDSDYSLYDKKSKGSFGSKKTKRDEVTQVTHIGSEITSGGNMMLVSGGDQHYQVAKLDSGKDLTLNSGGGILFEGVKDLHQESHEKSNTSLSWNSMSGKGSTEETLRQSELIAKGNLAIKAVDGLHIDVKQMNQQTVSEAIDAMVKADPDLAWLKDAEARGDVDWQLIKETHDSYKYSHSGLGQGAMLAIIIIVTVLTAGAASGAIGAAASAGAGSGSAMAAAGTAAMFEAGTAVGVGAAGLGNVIATAAVTSVASTAAVSVINNKGNLGSSLKDITSSDSIKGYLTSAAMAGVMPGYDPASLGFNLTSAQIVLMKSASDAFVNTVINGGSYSDNLGSALAGQASSIGMAIGFKMVGDWAYGKYDDGSVQKVMAHALMGGLLAVSLGGDFKTGAIAAGANEALINMLSTIVGGDKKLESMMSQLTGIVAAGAVGGDVFKGAEIAKYATTFNRQLHPNERELAKQLSAASGGLYSVEQIEAQLRLSSIKNTDIGGGTDIVAKGSDIYDTGGNWIDLGNGQYVQNFEAADRDIIAFIAEHTNTYSWSLTARMGMTSVTDGMPSNPTLNTGARDRLTGYALDEKGGYRVPIAIDGIVYAPRYYQCGSAECLSSGANIDFSDAETLSWLRAADAKAINDVGWLMGAAAVPATGGAAVILSNGSTAASLLSAYLKDDLPSTLTSTVLSSSFEKFAVSKGVPEQFASQLSNAFGTAGVWDTLTQKATEIAKGN